MPFIFPNIEALTLTLIPTTIAFSGSSIEFCHTGFFREKLNGPKRFFFHSANIPNPKAKNLHQPWTNQSLNGLTNSTTTCSSSSQSPEPMSQPPLTSDKVYCLCKFKWHPFSSGTYTTCRSFCGG